MKHNNYASNDLTFSPTPLSFPKASKVATYLLNKEKILGKNSFPNLYEFAVELDETALFPSEFVSQNEIEKVRTISLSGYQQKIQVVLKGYIIFSWSEEEFERN